MMTAAERAGNFLQEKQVDQTPFHPLVMRFAADQAGVPFSEYCLDYRKQADAMLAVVDRFGIECVHPSGWPYCEAIAYGLEVEFPYNDVPRPKQPLLKNLPSDLSIIKPFAVENESLLMNRVHGVAEYRERAGDGVFLCGHHEGVFAEYADLRGLEPACMDLFDHEDGIRDVFSVILENAKGWGNLQVQAGADCMSIGDAVCSQIGPELYKKYIFDIHSDLVRYYHSLGVPVKIHICGDISPILPDVIQTGADIIDIDHLVEDIGRFVPLLHKGQVFCGNLDPVTVLRDGNPELIGEQAEEWKTATAGRGMLAGGCEITPDTPGENLLALARAARN